MIEGFWIVQFAGMEGKGGGVVILMKGQVLGGDSGYTYIGTYEGTPDNLKATVKVQNFDPAIGGLHVGIGQWGSSMHHQSPKNPKPALSFFAAILSPPLNPDCQQWAGDDRDH